MDKRIIKKLRNVEQEVITSYKNGMTLKEIGVLHGVSPGTVRNFLINKNVSRRKRGPKSE